MIFIPQLSSGDYYVYEVEDGVMMLKEISSEFIYYFPASEKIDPNNIRKRPAQHLHKFESLITIQNHE